MDRFPEWSRAILKLASTSTITGAILNTRDGFNYLGFSKLAPQPPDRRLHYLGERIGVLIPGPSKQVLRTEGSQRRSHERFQAARKMRGCEIGLRQ